MFEISEYCDRIDVDKPDYFNRLQQDNRIDPSVEHLEELNEEDRKTYDREVEKHYLKYRKTWKEVIQKCMQYKMPNIVNANNSQLMQSAEVPLFVYPCFMRCGKQYFCIKYNKMKMNKQMQSPQLSPK